MITVSTLLGVLKVITKDSVPPSAAVGLLMVTVGYVVATLVIVPRPEAVVLLVFPDVTVPVKVNVSFPSTNASVTAGTVTVAVVCPAGMVTVVTDGAP